jgi:hypothetical protein
MLSVVFAGQFAADALHLLRLQLSAPLQPRPQFAVGKRRRGMGKTSSIMPAISTSIGRATLA